MNELSMQIGSSRMHAITMGEGPPVVGPDMHVHLGRPETRLHDLPPPERVAGELELPELALECLERRPRVDQRSQDHVAGRSARTVEVGDPHATPVPLD